MSVDWREHEILPCGLHFTIEVENRHIRGYVSLKVEEDETPLGNETIIVQGRIPFDGLNFRRIRLIAQFEDGARLDLYRALQEEVEAHGGFARITAITSE